MALANYQAYLAARAAPALTQLVGKQSAGNVFHSDAFRHTSHWLLLPYAGVAPTTAAACSDATTGALCTLPHTNPYILVESDLRYQQATAGAGILLCDRLSHQGGLSGIVATAQTTNLPTAALTRYTTGVGVVACIEIYSAIGATATTVTISYTNQAGTAGQISPATTIGSTSDDAVGRLIMLPVADGDSGVRAVASVTLAATTGTAGNFGVTLLKPLMFVPMGLPYNHAAARFNPLLGGAGIFPSIDSAACLMIAACGSTGTGGNSSIGGYLKLANY